MSCISALVALTSLVDRPSAMQVTPDVQMAQVAAWGTGNPDWYVSEVDIAASSTCAMAVFMHGDAPSTSVQIRYAFHNGSAWVEGLVDSEADVGADPTVEYDPVSNRFVFVYMKEVVKGEQSGLYSRAFDVSTASFTQGLPVELRGPINDKPWMVRGRVGPESSALFLSYMNLDDPSPSGVPVGFQVSTDGGGNFSPPGIARDSAGANIFSRWAPQFATPGRGLPGPLYLAVHAFGLGQPKGTVKLWRHDGLFSGPNPIFSMLIDAATEQQLEVKAGLQLAGLPGVGQAKAVPHLIADDSDPRPPLPG